MIKYLKKYLIGVITILDAAVIISVALMWALNINPSEIPLPLIREGVVGIVTTTSLYRLAFPPRRQT